MMEYNAIIENILNLIKMSFKICINNYIILYNYILNIIIRI